MKASGSQRRGRASPRELARQFARAREGAAAIEFALLAVPFLMLLFAIIETMVVFAVSISLEAGASAASRLVRTGQAQQAEMTREDMRNEVCSVIFMGCDDRMQLEVRRFTQFSDVDFASPFDAEGDLQTELPFEPGEPGDIVLVRVFYLWDIVTPMIGPLLSNTSTNDRLLTANAAFRNEPFRAIEVDED